MKIQWKIKHFKEKKRLCDPLCNHLYPTTHVLSALYYHSGTSEELRLWPWCVKDCIGSRTVLEARGLQFE